MCLVAFQKIFRKIFSGVWKRRRKTQIQTKSSTIAISRSTATARSRDRRFARSHRRSRSTDGARSRSARREIAIDASRDRDLGRRRDRDQLRDLVTARDRAVARSRSQIDRDLAPSRARAVDREIAPARSRSQIAIVDGIFLGFVFSFFFSKHQKIFSGKFFEMQPNTEKYFPFPEISISGKYVFSGKHFTGTKHSPNLEASQRRTRTPPEAYI